MTKEEEDTTVASTIDAHDIGTAFTRRPEPTKPKSVLTFEELLTIVWLRARPVVGADAANNKPRSADAQPGERGHDPR